MPASIVGRVAINPGFLCLRRHNLYFLYTHRADLRQRHLNASGNVAGSSTQPVLSLSASISASRWSNIDGLLQSCCRLTPFVPLGQNRSFVPGQPNACF